MVILIDETGPVQAVAMSMLPLRRVAELWREPAIRPGSWVCCRADGSPIRPSNFSSNFSAFVKRHGLPQGGMHLLRHSHASWLVANGAHPKEISKRLGHASISITMDVYADVFEEAGRETAACLDADFRAKSRDQGVTKGVTSDESET